MNSVGELVETILSRTNIADTNELAGAVESWRRASGGAPLHDDPRRQKARDLLIVKKNGIIRCWRRIRCVEQIAGHGTDREWILAQYLLVSSLETLLDPESLRVAIALRVGADVCIPHSCRCGGRMVSRVCMACPANTVLAAFQGIRQ